MMSAAVSEMATITVMARSIVQLMLLTGGALVCGLTAVVVMHLLGWNRDETDHG